MSHDEKLQELRAELLRQDAEVEAFEAALATFGGIAIDVPEASLRELDAITACPSVPVALPQPTMMIGALRA